jgi:hypothetical protein
MRLLLAATALVVASLAWTASQVPSAESSIDLPAEIQEPDRSRIALFRALQPVKLANCTLERFGEDADGGYLMCGNLLRYSQVSYSYGINGYDGWGCAMAARLASTTHQYDCFNLSEPACSAGRTVFHPLCVSGRPSVDEEGRRFQPLAEQIAANGDALRRLVVKMDVEGAEWDTLLQTPDEVLRRFDQLTIEMHGVDRPQFVAAVKKLKRTFHVANFHVNNYSCGDAYRPFPGWAYEVLFVNKRLTRRVPGPVSLPHPLDTPNNPAAEDCQPRTATEATENTENTGATENREQTGITGDITRTKIPERLRAPDER